MSANFNEVKFLLAYARNFLVPKKLAILATAENLKEIDELKKKKALTIQEELQKMKEVADRLKDYRLIIETKADEKGNLYAAIMPKKIGEALRERGIEVNPDYLEIFNIIKKVGVHQALFKYYDIEAKFEVETVRV
ncbi:MAG: large subunit ribosomal protein L9 [Parcubacteria group bacterium Gr01-1014_2]|nr:MAG: large subunit ribosomal protein L9 [Parcubacteria group bacterium Gr01-1014_2]